MTATLEQTQLDLLRLLNLVEKGEEVVITRQGVAVARIVPVLQDKQSPTRQAWLRKLAQLRESTATGKIAPSAQTILDDLRSDRG